MSNVANKAITLNLNSQWKPIGYKTVKDAIVALAGSDVREPTSLALDIEYELNDEGHPIFDTVKLMRPVAWEEWITLPVRPWDLTINSTKSVYRVPTVIISVKFDKMPKRYFKNKPTKENIFVRDGYMCQYTGEKLPRNKLSVDHIIPKSRGGSDSWENLVACKKDINQKKGNKLNADFGLSLIKTPTVPKPIDIMYLITEARHEDWNHFIYK